MFILDSLSLSAATKQQTIQKSQILKEFIKQQSNGQQQEKTINNLTIANTTAIITSTLLSTATETEIYEMTTHKYKQQQQQHKKLVEKVMLKTTSLEMIKNNSNENLYNDKQQTTAVTENNTTFGDNTMPQEEQQYKRTEELEEMEEEWHKVPVKISNCNSKCNCGKCNTTTSFTTYPPTIASTTNTFKATNVVVDDNVQEEKEEENQIMMTKMENNANVNTFVLQPPSSTEPPPSPPPPLSLPPAATTFHNTCIGMSVGDNNTKGILIALQQPKNSCNANNYSHDYDNIADDGIGGIVAGGSFCDNSNKKNNSNISFLNTNSFVTVQCALLTCENECKQLKQKQNGYENSDAAAAATNTAELSSIFKEQKISSYCSAEYVKPKSPLGNLTVNGEFENFEVDTVLENFEKFLNSVKLENTSLNQTIAECDDLIDLSENYIELAIKPYCDGLKNFGEENVIPDNCREKEHTEIFNDKFGKLNARQKQETTCTTDDKRHINSTENKCNFEQLVYCDLNETLEEQNLLENKEILELTNELIQQTTAAAAATTEVKRVTAETSTTINENIMMMTMMDREVNETKTPVTCKNVNDKNTNSSSNSSSNNSKEQWQTCARYQTETCQPNKKNSCSKEVTEQTAPTTTTTWSSSIGSISPQSQNTNTLHIGNLTSSYCCSTTTAELCNCQYTTAYKLRDFAKCLKPSADEDIIYTLNFKQNIEKNQNEKEKLQIFNQNQLELQENVTSDIKSIENLNGNLIKVNFSKVFGGNNENILYNNNFMKDTTNVDIENVDIFTNPSITKEIADGLIKKSENFLGNNKYVKLKDTQFSELEKFKTTPIFDSPTKKLDIKEKFQNVEDDNEDEVKRFSELEFSKSRNSQKLNELKFNCEEKIYTQNQKYTQPLLYLTFVWPTKNEGQVVTTRRQGNENQSENVTADKGYTAISNKKYNNNAAENFNANDDECFRRRVLEKTYGTCNIKDVGDRKEQGYETQNADDKLKEDLIKQSTLIDKQKREFRNQCLYKHQFDQKERQEINEIVHIHKENTENVHQSDENKQDLYEKESEIKESEKSNKKFLINYEKIQKLNEDKTEKAEINTALLSENIHKTYESIHESNEKNQCLKQIKPHQIKVRDIQENSISQIESIKKVHENSEKNKFSKRNEIEKSSKKIQDNLKSVIINEEIIKNPPELLSENEKCFEKESEIHANVLTSEKCKLQINVQENLINPQQNYVCLDNVNENITTKSLDININRNNRDFYKTASVYNQDNGENILNLNKGIKRLSDINENINNNNPQTKALCKTNNHHPHHRLIEEDHLNLEEFEASQRLKRLLQQHRQFRARYDTLPPTIQQQFNRQANGGKCTLTTIPKSLNSKIERHSKEILEGNLNSNNLQEGVVNTTATTTTTSKANKLQADYETTLERSSLHANEQKQRITENSKSQDTANGELAEEEKDKEEQGVKVSNNINTQERENKINSPLAYVTEKIVRLSQQQQILDSNPLTDLTTEKSQVLQKYPITNFDNSKISQNFDKYSPTEQCNLNLQHIVNTKQLVKEQEDNLSSKESATPPLPSVPPPPLAPLTLQLNEYKSAFVSTKPEIYKIIKPLTQTTTTDFVGNSSTSNVTLSEFDTQRFSDFFYSNQLTTPNQITNIFQPQQLLHVLPSENPEFTLYATNANTSFQCYDELLNENLSNENNLNNNCTLANTLVCDNDNVTADCEDDLISISSTTSSPCDCSNCQEQQEIQDRDRSLNFVPSPSNKSFKMREVNGQLRGLLKKPNRPPPTRKNRVVFDETRNEFFEADYIILIREDCAYDEEDEEPCTCGEHELVRLCCEEGCQCNYSTATATTADDNRTPQSPKFAPPIEFVDDAALSPPDGYKDNGLKNTLGGALSGHIFGAQHLQQLQVIQRLQQQRAAMLAARNNSQIPPPPPPAAASVNQQSSTAAVAVAPSSSPAVVSTSVASNNSLNQSGTIQLQQHSPDDDTQGVCTECAECAECAAKQLQQDAECNSPQCQEDLTAPLGVPAVALLPIHTSSPERRMTQKEIIAGEERPRYVLQAQYKSSPDKNRKDSNNSKNNTKNKFITVQKTNNQRYVVETITMTTTTVTERRIVREASEDLAAVNTVTGSPANSTPNSCSAGVESDLLPPALPAKPVVSAINNNNNNNNNNDLSDTEKPPPIPPKESSPTTQISGILKGGKLWKQDSISQSDDQNNTTSEDEAGSTSNGTIKRSVRFVTEDVSADDVDGQPSVVEEDNQINELIPIKKHSTLFKNALRPNSAVQQLFPSTASHQTLTSEALRAFDESKRAGCLVSTLPGSAGDSDTLRRSMERNILRRSLIKKKAVKSDISLEDRIKQLTCGIDEDNEESAPENCDDDNSKMDDNAELSLRDSPAGEENPQKFTGNGNNSDKSFSPNSSVSSSSSGSSAYKKITEIFNREKKTQEKIMEMEENPIVIIPQECRCPAAPDLGMGVQVPVVHTQIHRTPPRQTEPKRQFLSTLAPLTACVAGNKDDLSSYYTLAAAHHNQAAQNIQAAEYNIAAMMAGEQNSTGLLQGTADEVRKVAPDVIAGTPGQEQQDELVAFAQQEANRTEKIKKRYGNEPVNSKENKEINSDDDEGNDYGFNKRPSVRGIKPKFSSTNEILQQMQDQLQQQMPSVAHSQPLPQAMKSYTLPKQASSSAMTKQMSQQQPSPQNVPHPVVATSQQQLPQQQQICNAVAPQPAQMQMPANAAIAQQQTEQRTWSFYSETGSGGEQQRLPVESAAAAMQQTYYQTLPAGAMFRHTMIHQHQQHNQEEAMLYAQNCQAMATTIEPQAHYGHYARSPTRRPESPPPLRNYHQTMVLIPYNAETYSQFAATNMDPKVAHIQRQNILEYQQVGEMTQVTQQTIRVPIGYALPGMQLHVVAGRGQAAQYSAAAAAQTHHHQHQRIMTQRYQFAQDANMAGFSERGVPEGAAAVSHSDCTSSGMISPTTGQQIAMQQQQQQQQQLQLQQNVQIAQQQQQQQEYCQQQQQQQPQAQNNMQSSAAQGSVYYAMNV